MRPLDPRLVRRAGAARVFLAASVAIGAATGVLIVAQAILLSRGIAHLDQVVLPLAGVLVARAALVWLQEVVAHRAAAAVKSTLRRQVLAHALRLGPGWLSGERSSALTTLLTRGLDDLDPYFARYLPQLVLATIVPAGVAAWMLAADPIAGTTVLVTLPLIPLFMALVGLATQAHSRRRHRALAVLAHHFSDVVAGLPTLKIFGRAAGQAEAVRRVTDRHRIASMGSLRLAFLSSFVLELLASLSVALVAVGVGLRLVEGRLDLQTALLVLILAPEAYLPLRQVGAHFHASADGVAAAEEVFRILETPVASLPPPGDEVRMRGVTVRYADRSTPALEGFDLELRPGEVVALTGPSGSGKSTVLAVLLGFVVPDEGFVVRPAAVGWVPQRPGLLAGTVADNVRLGRPNAPDECVRRALGQAGLVGLDPATQVGELGQLVSGGQRRRIALARALVTDAPVLLLDEPTAGVDPTTEATIIANLRATGRTILMVAHHPALIAAADRTIALPTCPSPPSPAPVLRTFGPVSEGVSPTIGPASEGVSRTFGPVSEGVSRTFGPVSEGVSRTFGREKPVHQGSARGLGKRLPGRVGVTARRRLGLGVVLGVLASGSAVALLATSAWLIATAATQPPVLTLMVAIVAVRAFGIGRGVFRYAERLVAHDAAYRMLGETRARVTARLEPLAPVGLAHLRSGDLLARLVLDIDAVLDRWLRVVLPVAVAAITTIATVALLAMLFPMAGAAAALAAVVACTVVPWLVARTARHAERSLAGVRGELASAVTETVLTAPDVVAFGGVARALAVIGDADDRLRRAERRSAWSSGLGGALLTLCIGGASTAGLVMGAAAVQAGRLSDAVLAVVVLTPLALADVLGGLPAAAQISVRIRAALARVGELITSPAPVTETARAVAMPPGRGLEVRGLRAGYGAGPDVLSGLDLALPPGARVVVTGASGSGKSTLAAVLLRFLEPRAGQVLLDGVDITTLAGSEVRSAIGLMSQESHVFDTSIEENLRIARPAATDADLHSALTAAGLGEFVAGLPHGLRTMVGEHGARLSGGERQRLALARIILADFDILVLDEPTEHLDDPTARALLKDLYAASPTRTVVLLTHHPDQAPDTSTSVYLQLGRTRPADPSSRGRLADCASLS